MSLEDTRSKREKGRKINVKEETNSSYKYREHMTRSKKIHGWQGEYLSSRMKRLTGIVPN